MKETGKNQGVSEKYTIMIVEDDRPLLHLLRKAVLKSGFSVETAETGAQALSRIMPAPDENLMLLLDYQLPDMTGREIIVQLRRQGIELPFVVMTGYGDLTEAVEMMKLGALDYFEKGKDLLSILPAVLMKAVKQLNTERELLRSRELLLQSQRLESVGQVASCVAHDFNNVLTSVMSCSSLLRMKMDKDDPLQRYVDTIFESAEHGVKLVKGLLCFGRKQTADYGPADLSRLMLKMKPLLQRMITEDISLQMNLSDHAVTVMADAVQIEQVIINLLTNARDAMTAGGTVTVTSDVVETGDGSAWDPAPAIPGTYARISVSDTGGGMDGQVRERIFEPFFTTKGPGRGTGLGMPIVQRIVKQHDGHIFVESTPGSGCTVSILLPLSGAAVEQKDSGCAPVPARGTETLLLAEDDEHVRETTKCLLGEFGYEVIEACNGEEAVREFRRNSEKVDLLILDVIMPKKNGNEAYEEIRVLRPGIKTLFMSGYSADVLDKKSSGLQPEHLLHKPVPPDVLLARVRQLLDA